MPGFKAAADGRFAACARERLRILEQRLAPGLILRHGNSMELQRPRVEIGPCV